MDINVYKIMMRDIWNQSGQVGYFIALCFSVRCSTADVFTETAVLDLSEHS